MRTPAGEECKFYYEDFHRGRSTQTCRVPKAAGSLEWQPKDCAVCEVPKILLANSDPNLELELNIKRAFIAFGRKVEVSAHCRKHEIPIPNPYTGCPKCAAERPGLSLFAEALDE